MISLLRQFTKSWVFTAMMALLIASFAIFGLRDVFGNMTSGEVVKAGTRTVTAEEFKQQFDSYKQRYAQKNNGQTFTNEDFVAQGQHIQMLNEVANTTAFSAWLDTLGVKAQAKTIVEQIAKIPAFFNGVTGKFDKATYQDTLARNQLTQKAFEEQIADQIANRQYLAAAIAGFKAPRLYAAAQAAMTLQARDASAFIISAKDVAPVGDPNDAEITAFYQQHLSDMQQPEMRMATMVLVSPQQYMAGITVDDAELHKMYQNRLTTLVTPELRSFVTVSAPDAASAAAISTALKNGDTPEAAAKAHKGQVITYAAKSQTAVPDEKLAQAAFAMKTGDVSGAIQGSLGYAVVKMGDIKIGSTPSFEGVRDQLANDYRKEKAADKVNEVVHKFQDAHERGDDFDATAKALGLQVQPLLPMTADGQAQNPQTGQMTDYSQKAPAVVKDIYELSSAGATSDVEELGDGAYFALKLIGIKPAGAPPLAQVKGELAQVWKAQKLNAAISAKGDEAKARLDKGESLEAVAASMGAQVQHINGLDRMKAQQMQQQIPGQLAARIFRSKQGEVFTIAGQQGYIVGRVDAIHQPDVNATNVMTTQARPMLTQQVQQDLVAGTQTAARTLVKTTIYPKQAERVLGVTPADDSKDVKAPKDAKKDAKVAQ